MFIGENRRKGVILLPVEVIATNFAVNNLKQKNMRRKANWYWAVPLIVVGLVWQLSNMGYLSSEVLRIVVSWQALLMYIGGINIIRRQYVGGIITFIIGLLFILPKFDVLGADWLHVNWPIILIIGGILLLVKPYLRKNHTFEGGGRFHRHYGSANENAKTSYSCDEGYVETANYFGSVKQIVLDPVFKGARISNAFGGTVLDLRHTSLDAPETYIDVDCTFGGVEIYLPSKWYLQNKTMVILGGCEDKRFLGTVDIDKEHALVVRGNVSFGGVEFKS